MIVLMDVVVIDFRVFCILPEYQMYFFLYTTRVLYCIYLASYCVSKKIRRGAQWMREV